MIILNEKKIAVIDTCYLCRGQPVSVLVTVKIGIVRLNLALCDECLGAGDLKIKILIHGAGGNLPHGSFNT